MGHYDDIRDKIEERELEERAAKAGRSVEDQRFYENVYLPAKRIAVTEYQKLAAIRVYETHKGTFE